MNNFKVSAVIPVYNAGKYVRKAVESALTQPETAEVVLVEDASPDDSLAVCQALAEEFEAVHLFQHPGGANRGAGPSRNLGIEKSNSPFIAFLDADDFYLPERFTISKEIFAKDPDCDGVYEAIGAHYEDAAGKARWLASNMSGVEMTTITRPVSPENLFKVLIKGWDGHIHLNGLVIKRSVLQKSGVMNPSIADTLHEDTDFILKLAAVGRLFSGRLDQPVAMRRVHDANRVSAPRSEESIYRDKMRLRFATYRWCKDKGLKEPQHLMFKRALGDCVREKPINSQFLNRLPKSTKKTYQLLSWPLNYPEVLLEALYWRELGSSFWGILRNDIVGVNK